MTLSLLPCRLESPQWYISLSILQGLVLVPFSCFRYSSENRLFRIIICHKIVHGKHLRYCAGPLALSKTWIVCHALFCDDTPKFHTIHFLQYYHIHCMSGRGLVFRVCVRLGYVLTMQTSGRCLMRPMMGVPCCRDCRSMASRHLHTNTHTLISLLYSHTQLCHSRTKQGDI